MNPIAGHYAKAASLADAMESELKRINRWTPGQLPDEAFVNMGAFGSNTMAFEQWIQFVLLPRIRGIVNEKGDFPDNSMLGTYAIRVFDGDHDAEILHGMLRDLDDLVNEISHPEEIAEQEITNAMHPLTPDPTGGKEVITLGDEKLPHVVYALIDVLHEFERDDLESQLQTFDTLLAICSPTVRPEMSALLLKAADRTLNEVSKKRMEDAAKSVLEGGRAAQPYDHDKQMRKYREQFRGDFPEPE